MPLTNTSIRQIKPNTKTLKLFDGGGLFLQVTPAGGKWWRLKYRFQGKEKLLSLARIFHDVMYLKLPIPYNTYLKETIKATSTDDKM